MSKYLITGVSGFVGRYLAQFIQQNDADACVYGVGRKSYCDLPITYFQVDLKNQENVTSILKDLKVDYIIHLASMSSVHESWNNPLECLDNNAKIILNILNAVKNNNLSPRILSVGSSEEYGKYLESEMPLKESYSLNPINPYAVTKVFQEYICRVYAEHFGIDVVMTRSFNHFGLGQNEKFFIPSIIKQLVEVKNGTKNAVEVGNIDVVRDFIDVRDVVEIYYLLLLKGKKGEVYNVCSGKPVALRSIIENCCSILNINPEIVVDPARVRPDDIKVIYGDNTKIKTDLGWCPKYSFDSTLKYIITGY